jgi:hypothetical protein
MWKSSPLFIDIGVRPYSNIYSNMRLLYLIPHFHIRISAFLILITDFIFEYDTSIFEYEKSVFEYQYLYSIISFPYLNNRLSLVCCLTRPRSMIWTLPSSSKNLLRHSRSVSSHVYSELGFSFAYQVKTQMVTDFEDSLILRSQSFRNTPKSSWNGIKCSLAFPVPSNFIKVGGTYPTGYSIMETSKW